jgi:hypothetical protein
LGQAEFTGEAILKHAPKAFDAAFGLRGLRGDEGDAELLERATELRGLALAGELFVERPVIVVADRALSRRSQSGRVLWDRMRRLITRWLPLPTVCHSYPLRRMGVVT